MPSGSTGGDNGLTQLRTLFGRGRRERATDVALAEATLAGLAGEAAEPGDPSSQPTPFGPLAPAVPGSPWPPQRIALAEELWGEGFLNPGGSAELLRHAAPLGLSEAMSLLLLGAGAGGPPRVLASELGVWVSSYDSDAALVALAAERIQHAGAAVAKHATVEAWNPTAPRFRKRAFHHSVAFEALRDAPADAVLAALYQAIKPGGQLVLQELVAEAPLDPADPAAAAWCRLERRTPDLPAEATITETLQRLGFDVRVVEDQSSRHVGLVVQGWNGLIRGLQGVHPSRAYAAALVDEAELWARRIGLMHAGRIRLVRWHAIARAAV
jgi:hypothetical protein